MTEKLSLLLSDIDYEIVRNVMAPEKKPNANNAIHHIISEYIKYKNDDKTYIKNDDNIDTKAILSLIEQTKRIEKKQQISGEASLFTVTSILEIENKIETISNKETVTKNEIQEIVAYNSGILSTKIEEAKNIELNISALGQNTTALFTKTNDSVTQVQNSVTTLQKIIAEENSNILKKLDEMHSDSATNCITNLAVAVFMGIVIGFLLAYVFFKK